MHLHFISAGRNNSLPIILSDRGSDRQRAYYIYLMKVAEGNSLGMYEAIWNRYHCTSIMKRYNPLYYITIDFNVRTWCCKGGDSLISVNWGLVGEGLCSKVWILVWNLIAIYKHVLLLISTQAYLAPICQDTSQESIKQNGLSGMAHTVQEWRSSHFNVSLGW